ncbi:MAG: hypothetical protein FJZ16_08090 [Candidatus Omnitrophica bacterium]|nr:hypothetical protein [Candidatus Omnitrophota bacterium]
MRKRYKIIDADKVLKATHDAGITVTGNFMFGFPGEAEEDFQMTLDFIKRNAKYLDRVYPSRTFCAIEEFSYLVSHLEEFNINPNPPNHLYWETIDGKNTYPDRLRRCEEFCDLAYSLGIEVGCGVQTSTELDKWFNLGLYYEAKKNHQNAIECYLKYYKLDNKNEVILNKIKTYNLALENNNTDLFVLEKTRLKLMDILNSLNTFGNEDNVGEKMKRERSIKLEKNLKRDNSAINDEEIQRNRIALDSIPKLVFIQASGPCNSYCTFCSRGHEYDIFNLEDYRKRFEEKLVNIVFPKIECLALTGSGEFLLLKEAEAILDYFDNTLPHVNKMIFTNGSSLTPQIADKIINSKSKYIIHFSLHSSNALQHKVITRTDHFHRILGNLNYLLKSRKNTDNPAINLIFVATTLNIEDLPNFVKLAATLQVNKVLCYYNYIYMPSQKYLSCFFKQELTNKMIDEAADIASKLNVALSLPPKFNQKEYPDIGICREPWGQIMIDFKGRVIPCDVSGDCQENLEDKEFSEVWNSLYYQELRKSLLNKTAPCYKRCIRANPSSVDDFSSHVIHRGGRKDIDVLWADNF